MSTTIYTLLNLLTTLNSGEGAGIDVDQFTEISKYSVIGSWDTTDANTICSTTQYLLLRIQRHTLMCFRTALCLHSILIEGVDQGSPH